MDIFKRLYTMRRYGAQEWKNGRASLSYSDSKVKLDVQPAGDDTEVNAEGRRVYKKLTVYCDSPMKTNDQDAQTMADKILVDGTWYTCTSCSYWRNTILAHYECSFSAVPETEMER